MVEFLSVLIGLYTGVHPVELTATAEVATIEVQLDGAAYTVLDGPPWTLHCDFGPDPTPHELVAIARDADGDELDRATRWVNLADSGAAAAMSLESDAAGRPVAVRLSWESIGVRRPRAVEVLFDGEPLPVKDPRRVPLPRYDPEVIHFVSAVLTFTDQQVSRLEASFGGALGAEVRTELTAVAVLLERGAAIPRPAEMRGWFVKRGEPLAVHGVEKGPAEVIFVRDPTVQPHLERFGDLALGRVPGSDERGPDTTRAAEIRRRQRGMPKSDPLRHLAMLGTGVHLRFMAPGAAPLPGDDLESGMFLHSPTYDATDGGFLRISQQPMQARFPMQLVDALATAGMAVHATHRRRAVVALLGDTDDDRSQYEPEAVRTYLRQLHVPLAVWSFAGDAPDARWREARYVGAGPRARKVPDRFEEALDDLRQTLKRQRIVWLEGRHLPQEIELSPTARGISLAGR